MDKIKFLIKCLVVAFVPFLLNFCFVADINSYTRVMMSELYNDGAIDLLFLGASHTYRSFDTAMIEEQTEWNAFNAGSSSQDNQGSYYILKEAYENNGVDTVFLDVTYTMQAVEEPGKTSTYILTDYIHGVANKYEYLNEAFGITGIVNGILPVMHSVSIAPSTLKEHITKRYLKNSYDYITYDNEAYYGQGFVYSYETADEEAFNSPIIIDAEEPISDFAQEYLYKIIDYCRKNGIELILLNPPMPDNTLITSKNFQAYVEKIRDIANSEGLEYWDFNLSKDDVLTMEKDDYKDESHLNGLGAKKFTECFCKIINGEITEPFYDSYDEKLKYNIDNTVFEEY